MFHKLQQRKGKFLFYPSSFCTDMQNLTFRFKSKKSNHFRDWIFLGRGGRIRTCDLRVPNAAYATPR